jgi:outer membrane protein OmpA-like peptidoglycan-associated protein
MGKKRYKIGFVFTLLVGSLSLLHPSLSPAHAKNGEDDVCLPGDVLTCDLPGVVSLTQSGSAGSTVGVCGPVTVTITLSADSADFVATDVTVSSGVLSAWSAISPTVYTATFTPPADSTGSAVFSIAAGTFTDDEANLNIAFTSEAIPFDTQSPTVAITRSGVGSLGEGQTSTITFTLSEPSSNFMFGDVVVSSGVLSAWSAISPTVYTATFTPPADSTGESTISIAAGTFTDSCNLSKANVNSGVQFDTISIAHDTRVVIAPPPTPPTPVVAPTTVTTTPAPPVALPTRAVAPEKKQLSARVYFGLRSSELTSVAKKTLKKAVKGLPKDQTFEVVVMGMVQFSKDKSNVQPLAARRAEAVRAYLLTLGIKGKYEVSTRGIVGDTAAARRAIATVVYS